jgi:hypothetical protein
MLYKFLITVHFQWIFPLVLSLWIHLLHRTRTWRWSASQSNPKWEFYKPIHLVSSRFDSPTLWPTIHPSLLKWRIWWNPSNRDGYWSIEWKPDGFLGKTRNAVKMIKDDNHRISPITTCFFNGGPSGQAGQLSSLYLSFLQLISYSRRPLVFLVAIAIDRSACFWSKYDNRCRHLDLTCDMVMYTNDGLPATRVTPIFRPRS